MEGVPRLPTTAPELAHFAVRRVEPADAGALAELETRAFADGWSEQALAGTLANSTTLGWLLAPLPAEGSEAPIPVAGYTLYGTVVDEADLLRIAVLPGRRRRGLGRWLLASTLERLRRDHGVRTCHLEVRADNVAAQGLYLQVGFETSGRRPGYYPDGTDALLFRCSLADDR